MAQIQIKPPLEPKLCIWSDLSVHNVDQIIECQTTDDTKFLLLKLFDLDDSPRCNILLDLYLNTIHFAKSKKYTKGQISAVFSIIKQTHETCMRTPFGNIEEGFEFFREIILAHSVHRPPWSLEVFDSEQVDDITNYVIETYFRHYKLYKYAFTPKVRLDLSINYVGRVPSPEPEELISDEDRPLTSQSSTFLNQEEDKVESEVPETPSQEEALSELEELVRKAVGSQLKQMQLAVDKQLEKTEKTINDKIQIIEQGGSLSSTPNNKKSSPKGSARIKKK